MAATCSRVRVVAGSVRKEHWARFGGSFFCFFPRKGLRKSVPRRSSVTETPIETDRNALGIIEVIIYEILDGIFVKKRHSTHLKQTLRRIGGGFEQLEERTLYTTWYVAPAGSVRNAGTLESPWDLASALGRGLMIKPGDTIIARGGVYRHPDRTAQSKGFVINLQGLEESPITIRPYPGERATIDGGLHSGPSPAHLRIRDLEIIVSENLNDARVTTVSGSDGASSLSRPRGGIELQSGHNIKLINNVIHANLQGVGFWQDVSGNSEIYGNLIFDNGWKGPDRNHGHGIYTQNGGTHDDWKLIRNNILLDNWAFTLQAYGSAKAFIDRYEVSNNIFAAGDHTDDGRLLIGGSRPSESLRVHDNVSFHAELQVGYNFYSGVRGNDVLVTGNRIWWNIEFGEMTHFVHRDNFAWYEKFQPTPNLDGVIIDVPTTPYIVLNENAYDVNRAHLAIQNFPRQSSIAVDMSSFLAVGDTFCLLDPADFFGEPVYAGVYDGRTTRIAMDKKEFAAFVVLRQSRSSFSLKVPGALNVKSSTNLWINDIHVTTCDDKSAFIKVTISTAHGRITLMDTTGLVFTMGDGKYTAKTEFSGITTRVNAALGQLVYQSVPNFRGPDELTIRVVEQGKSGEKALGAVARSVDIEVQ